MAERQMLTVKQVENLLTARIPLSKTGIPMPTNMAQLNALGAAVANSPLIPSEYQDIRRWAGASAGKVVASVMVAGGEIGLSPMASLRYIAIINGRPTVFGDGLRALAVGHPDYGGMTEEEVGGKLWVDGKPNVEFGARVTIKRRFGEDMHESILTFTVEDAMMAGLWQRDNLRQKSDSKAPWFRYPKIMLRKRAVGHAVRAAFPDVLAGAGLMAADAATAREARWDMDAVVDAEYADAAEPPSGNAASGNVARGRALIGAKAKPAKVDAEPVAEAVPPAGEGAEDERAMIACANCAELYAAPDLMDGWCSACVCERDEQRQRDAEGLF